jgi:TRAP-type C4-dicarboxylate transport system permease small subunit
MYNIPAALAFLIKSSIAAFFLVLIITGLKLSLNQYFTSVVMLKIISLTLTFIIGVAGYISFLFVFRILKIQPGKLTL